MLLTSGLALAGIGGFFALPVAPLPQVDFPVISVQANLPGASPETMASSVATPLERRLGTIADVNEMTSQSTLGSTRITLQFDLGRDINGAAREVQAAINASRVDLPATLRTNPTYRKANPADPPVIILAMTSKTRTPGQIYDAVSNIVQQRMSQVHGVGDVEIGGGSLPAVRVELLPYRAQQVRHRARGRARGDPGRQRQPAKGTVEGDGRRLQIYTNDAGRARADYAPLVVAWRNGAAVRLGDVAQRARQRRGHAHAGPLQRQPGGHRRSSRASRAPTSSRSSTRVRALLPELRAQLPRRRRAAVASDRTNSIRAALHEIEVTLLISLVLVVLVVSAFLRSARATVCRRWRRRVAARHFRRHVFARLLASTICSLMALTVATGFVVDDAIVVLENTTRHIEQGMERFKAALLGAREVGFTVLSISISLVAVFIPLLFMGGIVGRLFREFAVTLSAAVMISLVISLTTTPMMCACLLRPAARERSRRPARALRRARLHARALLRAQPRLGARQRASCCCILLAVIGLNVYLFIVVPKGFFPQQDTGQLQGGPACRPEHLVAGDERKAAPGGRHHPARPGGDDGGRLHRRRRGPAAASCSSL